MFSRNPVDWLQASSRLYLNTPASQLQPAPCSGLNANLTHVTIYS